MFVVLALFFFNQDSTQTQHRIKLKLFQSSATAFATNERELITLRKKRQPEWAFFSHVPVRVAHADGTALCRFCNSSHAGP